MALTEALVALLLQARPVDGKDMALMALPRRAPATTLVVLLHHLALLEALVAGKALVFMIALPHQALVMTLVAGKALALAALLLQALPEDGKAQVLVVLPHLVLMMLLLHPAPVKALVAGVVLTLGVLLRPVLVKVPVAGKALVPTAVLMADR